MALYRFEAKVISRSGGRSAVNAAAYRTGRTATSAAAYRHSASLSDERTGKTFDYTRKRGVAGSEILAPDDAPDWTHDREKLWNEVERVEKRQDSQLSRDLVISLPHELTHEQRRALLTEFLQTHFVARGYLCDVAYHSPHGTGDDRNHHAHVMVPMRKLDANGFSPKKERPQGNPIAAWKSELEGLREDWAATTNRHLEAAGRPERVTHLSLAERGLDRVPEPKQGPLATQIEREGRESHAGNDRREAQEVNARRAIIEEQVTNVVSLAVESIKRGQMDEPSPELLEAQAMRQADRLRQMAEQRQERAEEFLQQRGAEAETARNAEGERHQAEERRAAEGGIASAQERYAEALAQEYDPRSPYVSLARAAVTEYRAFAGQQEELAEAITAAAGAERDALQLRKRVEAFEFMAATSDRLAVISATIAGREDAPFAVLDRDAANAYQGEAMRIREELAERQRTRETQAEPKSEYAAAQSEIVYLRESQMEDEPKPTPELIDAAHRRGQELYGKAREIHQPEQDAREALRIEAERVSAEAEKFRKDQAEREERDAARAQAGDIADPATRYAISISRAYDAKDPYTSLANAAAVEYAMFKAEQADLNKQAAEEKDPEKRKLIELNRDVQRMEYAADLYTRNGRMTRYVTGNMKSEQANRDDKHAAMFAAEGKKLRAERAALQK